MIGFRELLLPLYVLMLLQVAGALIRPELISNTVDKDKLYCMSRLRSP